MMSPYVSPGLRDSYLSLDVKKRADKIIEVVCHYYDEDSDFAFRRIRKKEVVRARYLCMYLIKKQTDMTLKKIGALFNHSYDHTTVLHAIDAVRDQLSLPFDNEVKTDFKAIIELL
jgi:chromosomal replication initiator protein